MLDVVQRRLKYLFRSMLSIAESLHLSESLIVHRFPDRLVQRALQRSLFDFTQSFVITKWNKYGYL